MTGFEIACCNRRVDGMIVRIGGAGWSLSVQEAMRQLSAEHIRFYVHVEGRSWDVGIREHGGETYLALEPDGFPLHNLLSLPSC